MWVRMLSGPYAGEVKLLPFRAATGAIRNGLAVPIEEQPFGTARPVVPPPVVELEEDEPAPPPPHAPPPAREMFHASSWSHHKRPGRRR
jgi:hypothetical protein